MSQGHYFDPSPAVRDRPGEVYLPVGDERLPLHTDAGVFSKGKIDRGTRLLLAAMERGSLALPEDGDVCDLGCGYGPIGIAVAKMRPKTRVYMVDINPRAVELAERNVRRHRLGNVQVRRGDGVSVFAPQRFDLIITNPPIRAGKAQVHALLTEAKEWLVPGGRLALVIRTQQGAKSLAAFLETLFPVVEEIEKGGGFRVYEAQRT